MRLQKRKNTEFASDFLLSLIMDPEDRIKRYLQKDKYPAVFYPPPPGKRGYGFSDVILISAWVVVASLGNVIVTEACACCVEVASPAV